MRHESIHGLSINKTLLNSPEFDGFWSERICQLLAIMQRTFGPQHQQILKDRQAFKAALASGETTFRFLPKGMLPEGPWKVNEIPESLKTVGPELISPLSRPDMAIKAARAYGEEDVPGLTTVLDNEDANHYCNTIAGILYAVRIWSGELRASYGKKDYHYKAARDGRGITQVRINGLGAAPLRRAEMLLVDGSPISRFLFEMVFFASHAIDVMKRAHTMEEKILLTPKIYVPKLESAEEAAFIDRVCEFIERANGVDVGTIKVSLVVENPRLVYELPEAVYALRNRCFELSYGRYDSMAAAVKNAKKIPPGPRSMSIKTAPAFHQFTRMVRVAHERGVVGVGGMEVPVGKSPKVKASVKVKKTWEGLFVPKGWVSAPHFAKAADEGFKQGIANRREDNGKALMLKTSPTEAQLSHIPDGDITEEEVDFLIRKCIEFMAAYLRGVGCCSYFHKSTGLSWPTMEDFATAGEYPVDVLHQLVKRVAMMKRRGAADVRIDEDCVAKKVAIILQDIEHNYPDKAMRATGKMSAPSYEQGYYRESALLFMAAVTAQECPIFTKDYVCWQAFCFLQAKLYPEHATPDELNTWAAKVLTNPENARKYPWYKLEKLSWNKPPMSSSLRLWKKAAGEVDATKTGNANSVGWEAKL